MRALLVAALLVVGCSPDKAEAPTETPLEWSAAVQDRLDLLTREKECGGLQFMFETAEQNGNTTLMEEVDRRLQEAECY